MSKAGKMKILFLYVIVFLPNFTYATDIWKMETKNYNPISVGENKLTGTQLHFSNSEGKKITYIPSEAPYVMVFSREQSIGGVQYFITSWAMGSATAQFKIFAPSLNANILCDFVSDGEDTELRSTNGKIEALIYKIDNKGEETSKWVDCNKRNVSSKVNFKKK